MVMYVVSCACVIDLKFKKRKICNFQSNLMCQEVLELIYLLY